MPCHKEDFENLALQSEVDIPKSSNAILRDLADTKCLRSIKEGWHVRKEIRIIGWDDMRHTRKTKTVLLVGPVFRGGQFMDGLLSVRITKDGLDGQDNAGDHQVAALRPAQRYHA